MGTGNDLQDAEKTWSVVSHSQSEDLERMNGTIIIQQDRQLNHIESLKRRLHTPKFKTSFN